jgi:hypothetical protein
MLHLCCMKTESTLCHYEKRRILVKAYANFPKLPSDILAKLELYKICILESKDS